MLQLMHKERMIKSMAKMFKTRPFVSERPWGYELWTLSTHRSGQSEVLPSGENLLEYLGSPLPILIKVIKANEPLSVQVHPDDAYANKYENDNGKTECWYILEAEEEAKLIAGIKPGYDRESMKKIIDEGRLEEVMEYIPVKAGDMVYIPAGTVHAIMGGLKLFEVQQSSDSTYRMYDWGRDREMHIEKSLDVIDYEGKNKPGKIDHFKVLETPYFNVEKVVCKNHVNGIVSSPFETINICKGSGRIVSDEDGQEIEFVPEDTIYIPQGLKYTVEGDVEYLRTY